MHASVTYFARKKKTPRRRPKIHPDQVNEENRQWTFVSEWEEARWAKPITIDVQWNERSRAARCNRARPCSSANGPGQIKDAAPLISIFSVYSFLFSKIWIIWNYGFEQNSNFAKNRIWTNFDFWTNFEFWTIFGFWSNFEFWTNFKFWTNFQIWIKFEFWTNFEFWSQFQIWAKLVFWTKFVFRPNIKFWTNSQFEQNLNLNKFPI
jgi:hypothetical protein